MLNNEHLFNIYLYDSVTKESFKSVESYAINYSTSSFLLTY